MTDSPVLLDGQPYLRVASGWIHARTRLRVDHVTARKLERLAASMPSYTPPDPKAALIQARNAQAEGHLLQAEQIVRGVLRVVPRHLEAAVLLCAILRDRERPREALAATDTLAENGSAALATVRAAAYADLAEWENARREVKRALVLGANREAWAVWRRIEREAPSVRRPRPKLTRRMLPLRAEDARVVAPSPAIPASSGPKHITITIMSACQNPGRTGAYAALLRYREHERELTGAYTNTTPVRLILHGVIAALTVLNQPCQVTIQCADPEITSAITGGWPVRWQTNDWIRSRGTPVVDADLWEDYLRVAASHQVACVRVRSDAEEAAIVRCIYLTGEALVAGNHEQDLPDAASTAIDPNDSANGPGVHRGWHEPYTTILPLADVLKGPIGLGATPAVYVARYCGIAVYIGMTRSTVTRRLVRHIEERSNLGVAMQADAHRNFAGWSVQILHIEGELEAAERYYIRRLQPPLNIADTGHTLESVTDSVRVFRRNYSPDWRQVFRRRKHR